MYSAIVLSLSGVKRCQLRQRRIKMDSYTVRGRCTYLLALSRYTRKFKLLYVYVRASLEHVHQTVKVAGSICKFWVWCVIVLYDKACKKVGQSRA